MGKQNNSEVMLAGLKAHSGNIANTFRTQNLAELLKPCSRKRRKRFWQLRKFAEAYETAAPVCQFRNIFSGPAACDFLQEFGRETALHRGQHGSPPLGDIDYRSARWKGSNQTVEDALHAGNKILGREQPRGIDSESGERQGIFLYCIALVLEQHHDHRDAQQHLRNRTKQVAGVAKNFKIGAAKVGNNHQHSPQCHRRRQQLEGEGILALRIAEKIKGAI